MKEHLENLHLEHLQTETSIAQLQRQFRDRGRGDVQDGNTSSTATESTHRRENMSPYRSLDASAVPRAHAPVAATTGAMRLENADSRRGAIGTEDSYGEGADGSGGRESGSRDGEKGDQSGSEAHEMLHRQLWSHTTPKGISRVPFSFVCDSVSVERRSAANNELGENRMCFHVRVCARSTIDKKLHRQIRQVWHVEDMQESIEYVRTSFFISPSVSPSPASCSL